MGRCAEGIMSIHPFECPNREAPGRAMRRRGVFEAARPQVSDTGGFSPSSSPCASLHCSPRQPEAEHHTSRNHHVPQLHLGQQRLKAGRLIPGASEPLLLCPGPLATALSTLHLSASGRTRTNCLVSTKICGCLRSWKIKITRLM